MTVVSRVIFVAIAAFVSVLATDAEARARYERHVVRLSVTHQSWDEHRPWAKNNPATRTASAVVVEGPFLLTRAQMVANATLIQVERRGDGQEWPARILHVDPEIDLALLEVEDPTFFESLRPAKLAKRVPTKGSVTSVRWNDRQLEESDSRVSTIDVRLNRYGNIEHAFLEVRTDFAGGGWAEPAFDGSKLVGLTAAQEDQQARIIPAEILRDYLERATRDEYVGFGSLSLLWQNNQDPSLIRYLGFEGPPRGILIREIRSAGSACRVLQPRDVLLELDGHAIDAIGNYVHPHYGNLRFTNLLVHGHEPGDRIRARVVRDGREQEVEFALEARASEQRRVPWRRENEPPAYRIAGGLVFRELDGELLRTWGSDWTQNAPRNFVTEYYLGGHGRDGQRGRVVALTAVLPDRYNIGYHDVAGQIVTHVNDVPIGSIADLERALDRPETRPDGAPAFHVVRSLPTSSMTEIVLDATQLAEADARIAEAYGIPETVRPGRAPTSGSDSSCVSPVPQAPPAAP